MIVLCFIAFLAGVNCGPATESYKNQYCTDPRTMRRHAAYTEWADAYSCTRHRCQPGGRNLAIYTVGCKRVEAPESAIECEEVVEDTNMQFPFCCTRLRCLVVVRGEVWTRVLGQPWEALPAAPWSHMYKMKKPPPTDGTFGPKVSDQGPVYELTSDSDSTGPREKMLRSSGHTESPDCNDSPTQRARAIPAPDIVIALSTDPKEPKFSDNVNRHKRIQNEVFRANSFMEERDDRIERERDGEHMDDPSEIDEVIATSEKPSKAASGEKNYNPFHNKATHRHAWTEIPQNQWNDHDSGLDTDSNKDNYNQQDYPADHKPESEKPANLQTLVDAIGSRMRDIEHVVQRMTDKVQQPEEIEKEPAAEDKKQDIQPWGDKEFGKTKKPFTDTYYKRFSGRNRSKYLHVSGDSSTSVPLFIEDTNMNGYFSDASNSVLRRAPVPKEPAQTFMAPVDTRRKSSHADASEEKKPKKHQHKKKKKGKHHKKHHDKRKFNRLSSTEVDKNLISMEDSSAPGAK